MLDSDYILPEASTSTYNDDSIIHPILAPAAKSPLGRRPAGGSGTAGAAGRRCPMQALPYIMQQYDQRLHKVQYCVQCECITSMIHPII